MADDLTEEEVESVSETMERMDTPPKEGQQDVADDGGPPTPLEATERDSTVPPEQEDKSEPAPSPAADIGGGISQAQFVQLEEVAQAADIPAATLEKMKDLKVNVQVVLGGTKMNLENILKLSAGSVVELDKLAGEPVDIVANDKLIARAEVVVIDGNFGVKVIDIAGMGQKLKAVT